MLVQALVWGWGLLQLLMQRQLWAQLQLLLPQQAFGEPLVLGLPSALVGGVHSVLDAGAATKLNLTAIGLSEPAGE